MKRIAILLGILCLICTGQGWSQTIDAVTVTDELSYINVNITCTFRDGCDRDTALSHMVLGENILIYVFYNPLPPMACNLEPTEEFISPDIIPPGDSYEIIVMLYNGTLGSTSQGVLLDSETMQIGLGSEPCEPCEQSIPSNQSALDVEVDVNPEVINIQRRAKYIGVKIKLSGGYELIDIDTDSIELGLMTDQGESSPFYAVKSEFDEETLIVKFDNEAITGLIAEEIEEFPAKATFFVRGELWDGTSFFKTDNAKIINRFKRHMWGQRQKCSGKYKR